MRQFAGFGTATETNERFHYLVEEGQTGLSTAFDMPTLMGIDSDDAMAEGEVGREGVAVDTLRDMEVLFDGIDLADVSTSFTINPSAPVVYAMYVALADERGVPREELRGTLQNDMFKEFIAQKEWVIPPEPSPEARHRRRRVRQRGDADVQARLRLRVSHPRSRVDGGPGNPAFTLADGFAYVEDCLHRGLDVDEFAPSSPFSSTPTTPSSRRSPSTAPPAASTPA